jgi:SAM-dependent methyltransferase
MAAALLEQRQTTQSDGLRHGLGRWCETAYTFGHRVYGYDFEAARQERDRLHGVTVLPYDEIPGQQFDFINTEQVFEHLAEPLTTLHHLVSGLRSGGMIRISIPNAAFVKSNLARVYQSGERPDFTRGNVRGLTNFEPLQHINAWTGAALHGFGTNAGLQRYRFPLRQMVAAKQDWQWPRGFLHNLLQPFHARWRYDDGVMQYFIKK